MALTFYRQPRFLLLLLGLVAAFGLSALVTLPRLEDPTLSPRFARIKTLYPGAGAERVETQVTKVLEDEIWEVEELRSMRSFSRPNFSLVIVELKDDVEDLEAAWTKVRAKLELAEANLPPGARKPELENSDVRAYTFILALRWNLDSPSNEAILGRLTEDLEEVVFSVPGSEKTKFFGEPAEEVLVSLDQQKLSALGLSPATVAQRLGASQARLPSGQMNGQEGNLLIELDTEFRDLDTIAAVPVLDSPTAGHLSLADVASIKKVPRHPADSKALVSGRPAVVLGVYCEPNQRVDLWSQKMRTRLDEFATTLPSGVSLEILFDQSDYVKRRFDTLTFNLVMGALAVMLVVLAMMGWRAALVVGTALPLTSCMVLAGMALLGIPIHQMSVTGLIIALGLLIDNAIVVTDEMQAELAHGLDGPAAIQAVLSRLLVPLGSSTATTVLAFLPIALLPGGVGEFVGSIAMTVILALLASLFLSLTVLPVLLLWLRPSARPHPGFTRAFGDLLRKLLVRPWLGVALSLLLPLAGFYSVTLLKEQFFPPTDRDQFRLVIEMPAQTSLEATAAMADQIRLEALKHPRVQELHWFIGRSSPKFYYNLLGNQENQPNFAEALVEIDSPYDSLSVIRQLQTMLDERFPGARARAIQLEQGPPFDAPVEVHLFGPDTEKLRQLGEALRGELSAYPEVVQTRASLSDTQAKLEFRIDERQARRAGLDPTTTANFLQQSTQGVLAGELLEGSEELPIRVRLDDGDRATVEALQQLDIPSPAGRIPLPVLGDFKLTSDMAVVARRDRRRSNTVQAFLTAGVLPATVVEPLRERLESGEFALPPGYSYEFGGEAAERDRAVGNLATYVVPLVVLMAGSLVLAFRSFRLAGVVALVGLLSVGLAFGSLYLLGLPIGFNALIGTMGLLGVAVNDSTVVLAALQERKAADIPAVVEVVVGCSPHVLATTFTTVAGFLPLLLGADRFWHPLAATIAGGVTGATLLALVLCPCLFVLLGIAGQRRPG